MKARKILALILAAAMTLCLFAACGENTDTGDTAAPLNLNIVNQLGEVRIFVPRSWHVDLVNENSMGSVNCRPDGDITTRTIVIRVKNQMGDVGIVSED